MPTVLLDRDGTVIVDPPDERIDSVDKIKFFPDSIEALTYLANNDYSVVFITNQAGIAEGLMNEDDFWRINNEVLAKLSATGIRILKTYMNSEGQGSVSAWRKPGPKMLLQAAEDFNLNLQEVYMVGDRPTDVQAGINAGCKGGILVKTANKNVESPDAEYVAVSLLDAVKYVVAHTGHIL